MMAEKPILFSGEMVRAILDGRKTQTRRVIKPAFDIKPDARIVSVDNGKRDIWFANGRYFGSCPYGRPGDLLWVRETWRPFTANGSIDAAVQYRADSKIEQVSMTAGYINRFPESPDNWRPSIFMPRWASRITLEVTAVRVERLQDISEDDAKAEGCDKQFRLNVADFFANKNIDFDSISTYSNGFRSLWDSINAKRGYGWDVNPFVWVVEFKKVQL